MTLGFSDPARQQSLVEQMTGWELYQLQLDKYHAMFWFENGWCLMNVAWRFAFISSDGRLAYHYDVSEEGGRKALDVSRILRRKIVRLEFPDEWELHLVFDNGDRLIVFDQPHERSCWFYRYDGAQATIKPPGPAVWFVDDLEPEDVGRIGFLGWPIIPSTTKGA
jgi:hypothetical protein